jgi:DHA2 family multidrug resistance protein
VVPTVNFGTLVYARIFQVLGLAFLFAPVSTIAYTTLPRSLNGDASSLFVMLRNVMGSIGISLATAGITQRQQTHLAYLQPFMTPLYEPYVQLEQRIRGTMTSLGYGAHQISQMLPGEINQLFQGQASLLAYRDLFVYCGIAAFAIIPLTFLFSPSKAGGGGGGGH